jgi:hypothetical protein
MSNQVKAGATSAPYQRATKHAATAPNTGPPPPPTGARTATPRKGVGGYDRLYVPAPTIATLVPSTGQNNTLQVILINGTGFTAQSIGYYDGVAKSTEYVDPTRLRMSTYTGVVLPTHSVYVIERGKQSNSKTFVAT